MLTVIAHTVIKKVLLVFTVGVMVLVGSIFYVATRAEPDPLEGYTKVDEYVEPEQATCDTVMPSCGYCPGEIIDKSCYIKSVELSNQELR